MYIGVDRLSARTVKRINDLRKGSELDRQIHGLIMNNYNGGNSVVVRCAPPDRTYMLIATLTQSELRAFFELVKVSAGEEVSLFYKINNINWFIRSYMDWKKVREMRCSDGYKEEN